MKAAVRYSTWRMVMEGRSGGAQLELEQGWAWASASDHAYAVGRIIGSSPVPEWETYYTRGRCTAVTRDKIEALR
jgi:hypothetical protein